MATDAIIPLTPVTRPAAGEPVILDALPQWMGGANRWLNWRFVGGNKVPYCSRTGEAAFAGVKSGGTGHRPDYHSTLEAAITAMPRYSGLGYDLLAGQELGVDGDGVLLKHPDGSLTVDPEYSEDVAWLLSLGSYAEFSPSCFDPAKEYGGLKFIFRGEGEYDQPAGSLLKNYHDVKLSSEARHRGIEIHATERFYTITRQPFPGSTSEVVRLSSEQVHELYARARATNGVPAGVARKASGRGPWTAELVEQMLDLCGLRYARGPWKGSGYKWSIGPCFRDSRHKTTAITLLDGWTGFNCYHDGTSHPGELHFEDFKKHYGEKLNGFAWPTRKYRWTDSGNAERLVSEHGENFRYVHDSRRWRWWDGKRWAEDKTQAIHRAAKLTVRNMIADTPEDDDQRRKFLQFVASCESRGKRESMVALAEKESEVSALAAQFDTDHLLLNVFNGTLDLQTGALRSHSREDLVTKLCPVEYRSDADCPLWKSFLTDIFLGNEALINFVQRAVGYTLTGLTVEQCFFLLHGVGNNGKTVLLETLAYLFGDYAQKADFETFMVKRGDSGPRNDVAKLVGARFVYANESEDGKRFAEALVKEITGGDTISARFLYQESFNFTPQLKLWLATNHEPAVYGTDEGIWRRIKKIPFNYTVPAEKRDPHLCEKLKIEVPGILRWALEGLAQYWTYGLQVPVEVETATDEYRASQNLVKRFLDACIEKTHTQAGIDASELYGVFDKWAKQSNEFKLNATRFGVEAKKLLQHKRGNTGRVVYLGIKVAGRLAWPDGSEGL